MRAEKWQVECRVFMSGGVGRNARSIDAVEMIGNGGRLGSVVMHMLPG